MGTAAGSALAAALSLRELTWRVGLPTSVFTALTKSGLAAGVMVLALRWLGAVPLVVSLSAFFRLAFMLPLSIFLFGLALWLVGGVAAGDVEVLRHLATVFPRLPRRLAPPR